MSELSRAAAPLATHEVAAAGGAPEPGAAQSIPKRLLGPMGLGSASLLIKLPTPELLSTLGPGVSSAPSISESQAARAVPRAPGGLGAGSLMRSRPGDSAAPPSAAGARRSAAARSRSGRRTTAIA